MGDHTLFFYGTLLAPPVLHRVIYGTPHPTPLTHPAMTFLRIRPALLRGYTRHRVENADYPAIVRDKEGTVRGSVVSGLTEGDVFRLDIFEGSQYTKGTVQVEVLGDGVGVYDAAPEGAGAKGEGEGDGGKEDKGVKETITAQTYIWSDSPDYLESKEWDFEDFKARKMRRWMGDPASDVWSDHGDEAQGGGWGNGDDEDQEDVQVDSGFADVDEAVKKMEQDKKKMDPTGGRGVSGAIGRQLAEAQRNGNGSGNVDGSGKEEKPPGYW
jgi:hypothetical protein